MGFNDTKDNIVETIKQQADIVKIIGECVDLRKAVQDILGSALFTQKRRLRSPSMEDSSFFIASAAVNPVMSSLL